MLREHEMYRVVVIAAGEVKQHMSTDHSMAVRTFYETVCNAVLCNTPCDAVFQTSNGIAMSFHSTGVNRKKGGHRTWKKSGKSSMRP